MRNVFALCMLIASLGGAIPQPASGAQRIVSSLPAAGLAPVVTYPLHSDRSPALRDIKVVQPIAPGAQLIPPRRFPQPSATARLLTPAGVDSVIQHTPGAGVMPAALNSFEGISNPQGYVPPDTNGAVGRDYYVQAVNIAFAVYSKTTGALVYGPIAINTLWNGFGGLCQTSGSGDPIVLYDALADRWLISDFAFSSLYGPFLECVAISTSSDPTGAYYRYAYAMPDGYMNDYPKFGVWPDGYYMSANLYTNATSSGVSAGAAAAAFDRSAMLAGALSPAMVFFELQHTLQIQNRNYGNLLPSNLDGANLPPDGAPNYYASIGDIYLNNPSNLLRIWQFHVDWTTPLSSTFGVSSTMDVNSTVGTGGEPNATLQTAPYNYMSCALAGSMSCIPQPGVTQKVDVIGDRIMHRLAYRNFGSHQSLVLNHTVDAGNGIAGIRWYEVRDPGGTPSIYQQGTYSPDSNHRWMGSIAMDGAGNIALGYSVSSSSTYPSIRYAGRLASDPLGDLTQGEQSIVAGTGSQTTILARWGDYSGMSIDPTDDCTFWYTNEYYATTGPSNWQTRIGAFKFPGCGAGWLTGAVTDLQSGLPISGAIVNVSSSAETVAITTTNSAGMYALRLDSNTYTLTASAYGYPVVGIGAVSVSAGATTTQNITLTASAMLTVTGVVSDIVSTAPLAAQVSVAGSPFNPPIQSTATDAGGNYTLTLAGGQGYTLTAMSSLRPSQTRDIGALSTDRVENFALWHPIVLALVFRQ